MQYRIITGATSGFFAMSIPMEAPAAVATFLDLARQVYPDQLENGALDEFSLQTWATGEHESGYMIYVGDKSFRIAISPVFSEERLPTLN